MQNERSFKMPKILLLSHSKFFDGLNHEDKEKKKDIQKVWEMNVQQH